MFFQRALLWLEKSRALLLLLSCWVFCVSMLNTLASNWFLKTTLIEEILNSQWIWYTLYVWVSEFNNYMTFVTTTKSKIRIFSLLRNVSSCPHPRSRKHGSGAVTVIRVTVMDFTVHGIEWLTILCLLSNIPLYGYLAYLPICWWH